MKRSRIIRPQLFLVVRGHPASLLFFHDQTSTLHYTHPPTDILLHDTPICLAIPLMYPIYHLTRFSNPHLIPDFCAHPAMSIIHFSKLEYQNHKTRHQQRHLQSSSPRLPKNTQRTILHMITQYTATKMSWVKRKTPSLSKSSGMGCHPVLKPPAPATPDMTLSLLGKSILDRCESALSIHIHNVYPFAPLLIMHVDIQLWENGQIISREQPTPIF